MTAFDPAERTAFLQAWVQVWNERPDPVQKSLRFYTENASFIDMTLKHHYRGHNQLLEKLRPYYDAIPDWTIEGRGILVAPDHAVVQWTWSGTVNADLPTITIRFPGRHFAIPGVTIFNFADNGLISCQTEYWNGVDMLQQLGISAD